VAGEYGRPHRIAYCASKGGAIAFTRALAVDLSGKNICVNALAPALIDTPLNAAYATDSALAEVWGKELLVRRWGRPGDVAAAALYLASDDADFVTGTVLTVDGGWTAALLRANELD
jgi:NAD(P)-dependent dehydrogenase (short-subunit alcohol dehydrogenase family)